MQELADVKVMQDFFSSGNEISEVERLLNEFEAHEAREESTLELYRKALGEVKNPVNRFVLQMILSDEEKHRAVTHALVATLKGSLTWTKPEGTLEGGVEAEAINGELLAATEDLINLEKAGIREYKLLARDSNDYYRGLFTILLNVMIRDSEKHVELLEFLHERLKKE